MVPAHPGVEIVETVVVVEPRTLDALALLRLPHEVAHGRIRVPVLLDLERGLTFDVADLHVRAEAQAAEGLALPASGTAEQQALVEAWSSIVTTARIERQ